MNFSAYRRWSIVRERGIFVYSILQTAKYLFFALLITTALIILFSDTPRAEFWLKISQWHLWLMIGTPIWFGSLVHWLVQEYRYRKARKRHLDYILKKAP